MAYTIAAAHSDGKQRFKLTDFLLRWGGSRRRQSGVEQLSIFRALAARMTTKE